jgi:hypothetical protein
MQKMKTPCDLADGIKGRKVDGVLRATFFLSRSEARRRAKQLFEEFPSGAYMTEIEAWRELPGGVIGLTIKRLKDAIDELEMMADDIVALRAACPNRNPDGRRRISPKVIFFWRVRAGMLP